MNAAIILLLARAFGHSSCCDCVECMDRVERMVEIQTSIESIFSDGILLFFICVFFSLSVFRIILGVFE